MIKLAKLTDYAVVVLGEMSRQPGVHTVAQLATRTGVPEPTVAKLMKTLTRDRLVRSQRGAAGGYVLGRAAEDVSMADIVVALEGPIALTACVDGASGGCGVESLCAMRGGWDKLNRAIRTALEEVTLADMAAPANWPLAAECGAAAPELVQGTR